MKARAAVALGVACALIGAASMAVPIRKAQPGDFFCTIEGVPSFIVEDADDMRALDGGFWRIETEAVSYQYQQRTGEACSVERLP